MTHVTLSLLNKMKQRGERIAVLTVYDVTFAKIMNEANVDVLLIGDSLGTVIQGADTTLPVTLQDMIYHVRCVKAGNSSAFLLADMPFMSYCVPEKAMESATQLMQAGAEMVKVEGGAWLAETITQLTQRGIPVCGHIGLTPQSVHLLGGYKIQGRNAKQAQQLLDDALALEKAGAQLLVVECIPSLLAAEISKALSIPVIGIGAGPDCDGQVLVVYDMLGIFEKLPSFSKDFVTGQLGGIKGAITSYVKAVKEGQFPDQEHSFT